MIAVRMKRLLPLVLVLLGLTSAVGAQTLRITNGPTAVALSAQDIAAMPHVTVEAYDTHEKSTHQYTGVAAQAILEKAGVVFGEKLRGRALGTVVLAHAADGYAIAFALAEFDPAFRKEAILLVDRQDGQPLPSGMGPYRLMCPGDARPARWVRMLAWLEIVPPAAPKP